MTRYRIVPETPTGEQITAYGRALKALINSVPHEHRNARWPVRQHRYRIADREKATARYNAMLAAAPRFEPTEAMVERVARALYGPANAVYDKRWELLHQNGIRQNATGDFVDGRESYLGSARAAISAMVEAMEEPS